MVSASLAVVSAAAVALAAGCSTSGNPVPALTDGVIPRNPMPVVWQGGTFDKYYVAVLGPVNGSGTKTFFVPAEPDVVFWVACVGPGDALLQSTALGLNWKLPCNNFGDPAGIEFDTKKNPVPKGSVGVRISTTSADARWQFRFDEVDPKAPPVG